MTNRGFNVVERLPTVEEYQALRRAVGWAEVDAEAAARGLANSLFSVCVVHEESASDGRAVSHEEGSAGASPSRSHEDCSVGDTPSRSHGQGKVVGCGRVVGDGGIYFYIQDVMVLPAYQQRGLGRRIMDAIMTYIAAHAGSNSFIGLMAANGVAPFYHRYGFAERPPNRPGMFRMWKAQGG